MAKWLLFSANPLIYYRKLTMRAQATTDQQPDSGKSKIWLTTSDSRLVCVVVATIAVGNGVVEVEQVLKRSSRALIPAAGFGNRP